RLGTIPTAAIICRDFVYPDATTRAVHRVRRHSVRRCRRVRLVLITVGAMVLALFPLALHGGPLWEALCFAQIGGLTLATAVTLFLVPVFYSVFVLDLRIVKWTTDGS